MTQILQPAGGDLAAQVAARIQRRAEAPSSPPPAPAPATTPILAPAPTADIGQLVAAAAQRQQTG